MQSSWGRSNNCPHNPPMLGRQAIHALKALLELAGEPERWRSVNDLAEAQQLPAPMLEQLLLQLRRSGLLEAKRGRLGGYRLARPANAIPLAAVLAALQQHRAVGALTGPPTSQAPAPMGRESGGDNPDVIATERVTALLESRLQRALERELARCTLAELHFDLRSASAALSEEGGLLLG
jgi:Rrf2 family iron-sulfur cluster assembly transcriptional regulator